MPLEERADTEAMKETILHGISDPSFRACTDERREPPSKEAISLIRCLLARAPTKRPYAEQALCLAFMRPDAPSTSLDAHLWSKKPKETSEIEEFDDPPRRFDSKSSFFTVSSTQVPSTGSLSRTVSGDSFSPSSRCELLESRNTSSQHMVQAL